MHKKYFECMDLTLGDMVEKGKGNPGVLGRFISSIFSKITGEVGAVVIMMALFVLCLFIFHGVEFMAALRKRNAYKREMEDTYKEISNKEDYKAPSYRVIPQPSIKRQNARDNSPAMQSVNLMEMNMTLDEIEERKRKQALGRNTMEEIVAGNIKPAKKEKPAIKKPEEAVIPFGGIDNPVKEEIMQEAGNSGIVDKKIPVNNENDTVQKQETDDERRKRNIESIPVFRDELDKKFGRKRNSVQETSQEPLFPIKDAAEYIDTGVPEKVTEPEDFSGFNEFSNDYINDTSSDINDNIILVKAPENNNSTSGIAEDTGTNVKAAASKMEEGIKEAGITKEDIIEDIKEAEETEETESLQDSSVSQMPAVYSGNQEEAKPADKPVVSPKPEYKRPGSTNDHNRIGGDNYVSASGTFNALNDSKEAALAELPEQEYIFPYPGLLKIPEESSNGMTDDDLRNTAAKLQDTLKSFNVNVQMGAVTCGPTVTRYELFPEQGVRVNKITNLADDLKLSLAAQSIRIEAPIPGKSAVGIEVPNPEPGSVGFRELLESEEFTKSKSPVTFAVGKDIGGKIIITDIAKMPHLLIAGATGSGKSVCINTLIMSILYKADPDDVKLIMIDPKVVELSVYNGIPHLFCPVVTDPKEASAALNWAVREMMDRYNKFTELGVRNITGYNKKIKTVTEPETAGYVKMPSLVIIVDEFADLMMVASKEVEDAVCRLAQLARAAGIHLVLATQRPSVNVITGIIKANIPSRIAFSVSSAIDSRTILDKSGAEKLIGKGDMLFFPSGYSEPVRVQGAFVSDKEVSDVVEFLRNNNEEPDYNENVTEIVDTETADAGQKEQKEPKSDRDEYFEDAGRFVIESERAAAGQLQRRFSIGFNRAGRIIDQLHKAGVVGPAEGTKPRKILMTMNDFDLLLGKVQPVSESEIEETLQNYSEASGMEGMQNEQY
ncbi:MAG: DNA translocase FtsK [Lachnospiraceae bacterium]|nr:DNA translocase FtsK [Lachnospiraceae bacterium]